MDRRCRVQRRKQYSLAGRGVYKRAGVCAAFQQPRPYWAPASGLGKPYRTDAAAPEVLPARMPPGHWQPACSSTLQCPTQLPRHRRCPLPAARRTSPRSQSFTLGGPIMQPALRIAGLGREAHSIRHSLGRPEPLAVRPPSSRRCASAVTRRPEATSAACRGDALAPCECLSMCAEGCSAGA